VPPRNLVYRLHKLMQFNEHSKVTDSNLTGRYSNLGLGF